MSLSTSLAEPFASERFLGIKLVDNAIDLVDEEHSLLPDEKVLVAAYRF